MPPFHLNASMTLYMQNLCMCSQCTCVHHTDTFIHTCTVCFVLQYPKNLVKLHVFLILTHVHTDWCLYVACMFCGLACKLMLYNSLFPFYVVVGLFVSLLLMVFCDIYKPYSLVSIIRFYGNYI